MMVTATAPVIIDPIASRMAGMTLALPAPAIAAEEPAYKEELQSFVVGSQVLSFVESVSTEYREAINNCCLLAHLYTKDQIGSVFEKGTMLFDWYNLYFSTLLNLGWTPQVQEFKVYEAGSDGADVSQALIELATSFLGGVPGAVGIIKGVLGALTKLEKDNPWITLFERERHICKLLAVSRWGWFNRMLPLVSLCPTWRSLSMRGKRSFKFSFSSGKKRTQLCGYVGATSRSIKQPSLP